MKCLFVVPTICHIECNSLDTEKGSVWWDISEEEKKISHSVPFCSSEGLSLTHPGIFHFGQLNLLQGLKVHYRGFLKVLVILPF